jgi:peptidyl-prolyl cis-trans isomerase A (cyclophilin A)
MKRTANCVGFALALGLAACGGGGEVGAPTVSTMSSTAAQYSRSMTITVQGRSLLLGIDLGVDGPCTGITRSTLATDDAIQFTCTVTGVEPITAVVRNSDSRQQLASLKINAAPAPQLTMTLVQDGRAGSFNVVLELDPARAPVTVENFMAYATRSPSFYVDTIFHRVVSGFVAQGGGFTTAEARKLGDRNPIVNEAIASGLKNLAYTIAMAREDAPDSATTQFFVNLVYNPSLDPGGSTAAGYAVFGRVVSGQEVIDELGRVPTRDLGEPFGNLPVNAVRITAMRQTR